MKKIFYYIIAVVMVISLAVVPAFATEAETEAITEGEVVETATEAIGAELLDETVEFDENCELKVIAEKLAIVNEQIANHNECRRKILRAVFIVVSVLAVCSLIGSLIGAIHFQLVMNNMNASTSVIGGYDGPTNIFVSRTGFRFVPFVLSMIIAVVSFAGIYKTRKK